MSRPFQFSLGRLFGALSLLSIAAACAAALPEGSGVVVFWLGAMSSACGGAVGLLLGRHLWRGLATGAAIGAAVVFVPIAIAFLILLLTLGDPIELSTKILPGPLLFLADPAPPNQVFGLVALPVLSIGIVSVFVKPNVVSGFLCALCLVLWMLLGVAGVAIGV